MVNGKTKPAPAVPDTRTVIRYSLFIIYYLLALLVALPLQALDVSSFNQGALTRRGRGWEQRLEFEAPVKEGTRLLLRVDGGAVNIIPGPGDKLKCVVIMHAYTSSDDEARGLFRRFQIGARSLETGGVYISSQSPPHARSGANFGVQFQVSVPQHYNLDVETQSGDITVEAPLEGEARLTTAGGDVRASDLAGPVRIETAGGSIKLGKIGDELIARTAGGSIRVADVDGSASLETGGGDIVTGQVRGTLHAETAAGDLAIAGADGQVVARSAGGQIQIGWAGGGVRAETAGGSIRLQGARGRVVVETAGGSIDLRQVESAVSATTAAGRIMAQFNWTKKTLGPSQLETGMGDVFVYLPVNAPLNIDAAIETAAGRKIESDFPLNIQGDTEELVPTTLRGRGALNGGGETLKIRTVAGNIEIRKLDEASLRELQQKELNNGKAWEERRAERERRRQKLDKERQQRQQERNHDDQ
jgi:DUF4097 and DUF4098 domain-containing protein YvlB